MFELFFKRVVESLVIISSKTGERIMLNAGDRQRQLFDEKLSGIDFVDWWSIG